MGNNERALKFIHNFAKEPEIMQTEKITITLFLIYILSFIPGFSQAQKLTIRGRVTSVDISNTVQPLPYANVSLYSLPDSLFLKGCISSDEGIFELKTDSTKGRNYVIKVSYTGCTTIYRTFRADGESVSLGDLQLKDNALQLKEIVVTAPVKAVEQKEDTIIYNVSAYKIPEGAYLEALIRRVPGLSYNPKEHSISYNGHSINEITVNGKAFFQGNNAVALENLPVSFLSKIRVFDKATEEEEATGIKSSRKNYVLDIQTKEEINSTVMVNAEAGYGNKQKRNFAAQAFKFDEGGNNFGLLGNSTNKHFQSLYKGNIANNLNGNITRELKEGMSLSANIGFSNYRQGSESSARNEQYLSGYNQYNVSERNSINRRNYIRGASNFSWKIDKNTSLFLSGSFGSGLSKGQSNVLSAGFSANPELSLRHPFDEMDKVDPAIRINRNDQQTANRMNSLDYQFSAGIVRKLDEKGNNINITANTSFNRQNSESYNLSQTTLYQKKNTAGLDSVANQSQYQYLPNTSASHELKFGYTQAFNEHTHLQLAYTFKSLKENQEQNTYDLSRWSPEQLPFGKLPEGYESGYCDSLSNRQSSTTTGHQVTVSFNYQGERWGVNAALDVQPQRRSLKQDNHSSATDTASFSLEWRPSFSVSYTKNNYRLEIMYNGNTIQPSLQDLLSPTDYRSPLYIRKSNPNLRPAYQQYLNILFSNYNKGISAYFSVSQAFNEITPATIYNPETGGTITYPVNINGNWGLQGNASYEKQIRLFRVQFNGSGNYRHDVSLVNEENNNGLKRSSTRAGNINTRISLSYLPSWGNIDFTGEWSFNRSENSLYGSSTCNRSYTAQIDASFSLPWHLELTSESMYTALSGTGVSGNEDNEMIWNLKLAWRFLKKRQAELSVYWADILNQQKSISRTSSANGFYERYERQLGSYFLVSVKYRFNNMKQ